MRKTTLTHLKDCDCNCQPRFVSVLRQRINIPNSQCSVYWCPRYRFWKLFRFDCVRPRSPFARLPQPNCQARKLSPLCRNSRKAKIWVWGKNFQKHCRQSVWMMIKIWMIIKTRKNRRFDSAVFVYANFSVINCTNFSILLFLMFLFLARLYLDNFICSLFHWHITALCAKTLWDGRI